LLLLLLFRELLLKYRLLLCHPLASCCSTHYLSALLLLLLFRKLLLEYRLLLCHPLLMLLSPRLQAILAREVQITLYAIHYPR
jgi:hypothetical protein